MISNKRTTKVCSYCKENKSLSEFYIYKTGVVHTRCRKCANKGRHPLLAVWAGMKARCYNVNNGAYHNYGGNGVTVCEEWIKFKPFFKWALENGWKPGLQIDKDKLSPQRNGKIYSPEYCCFLSQKENQNNRRNNVMVEYNGQLKTVSEWSEEKGIEYFLLHNRVEMGWQGDKLFSPARKTATVEINGITKSVRSWAREFGVRPDTARVRYSRGYRGELIFYKGSLKVQMSNINSNKNSFKQPTTLQKG